MSSSRHNNGKADDICDSDCPVGNPNYDPALASVQAGPGEGE